MPEILAARVLNIFDYRVALGEVKNPSSVFASLKNSVDFLGEADVRVFTRHSCTGRYR